MAGRPSAAWGPSLQGMVCSTQASSACRREAAGEEALQDVCRKADPVLIASLGKKLIPY